MNMTSCLGRLAGVAALSLVFALPAVAVPTIEYSAGEGEFGVAYEEEVLFLHYHFHAGAVLDADALLGDEEFDPSEVYVRVPSSQLASRPADSQWDFIGTSAGGAVWGLPQGDDIGVPFLGAAAEEEDPADWAPGSFSYIINSVSRPAGSDFSIFHTNISGTPIVAAATSSGLPDSFIVPAGSHTHYAWGFTAEGIYQVEITAVGTHLVDGAVSDTATFWFAVGDGTEVPEPSTLLLTAVSCGLCVIRRRRSRP